MQFGWWTSLPVSDDGGLQWNPVAAFRWPQHPLRLFCNASSVTHYPLGSERYRAPEMRQWQLRVCTRRQAKDFRYDIQEKADRG
jgi:hypothetical protein